MSPSTSEQDSVDHVLIAWMLIWSWVLTFALIRSEPLVAITSDEGQIAVGLAAGGLSAVWTLIGTWIGLINLPKQREHHADDESPGQRLRPRLILLVIWLVNVAVVSLALHRNGPVLAEILLTALSGVMGPFVVWQWTSQRIYRGKVFVRKRRSIRQILGIATSIAVVIAALKMADEWFKLPGPLIVLVVSSAVLWLFMVTTTLGQWWGMIALTIPVVIVQCMIVAMLVDLHGLDSEALIMHFMAFICCYYCISMVLLMLMRSSRHRWINSTPFKKLPPASPNQDQAQAYEN
ncbi:MAG: hypothetical protein KDB00_20335 [Planctomycetales bacterium]|nr:hypothetical protein [Planctomycetales bacterium]